MRYFTNKPITEIYEEFGMKRSFWILFIAVIGLGLLVSCKNQDTPSPELNGAEQPEQEFIFFSDRYDITQGECTILRWEVIGGYGVLFYDEELPLAGEMEICPTETEIYVLGADMGTHVEERIIEISVHPTGSLTEDELKEVEAEEAAEDPLTIPERPEIIAGRPAYQAGTWQLTSGPPGGLGYDIRMDPRNPDVMYVTDAWAGAFKSLDGGANWFPINNGITTRTGRSLDGIPVFSLSIDPNNPDTLWALLSSQGTLM